MLADLPDLWDVNVAGALGNDSRSARFSPEGFQEETVAFVKKEREQIPVSVDYLGFTIPDVWVVGYGLDYAERFRTLPYVAELKEEVYSK